MGNLTNAIVVLTTINLLCVIFSGFLGVATLGDVVTTAIFDGGSLSTPNPKMNTVTDSGFVKVVSQQEGGAFGNIFQFLDGLKKVFNLFITVIGLGFGIFTMLFMTGAPPLLCSLVGLPIAIGYYFSIVSAVRGMDV